MEQAAAHGIRWHESLAGERPGTTPGRRVAMAATLFLAAAIAALMFLEP